METYAGQPTDSTLSTASLNSYITDFLTAELPDCGTNRWFIKSVHLPNMVDKLVEELKREFLEH